MNNERRKEIDKLLSTLNGFDFTDIAVDVRNLADEEEAAAESMEENFPGTERADRTREAAGFLMEAADLLDQFEVDEVVSNLEQARDM